MLLTYPKVVTDSGGASDPSFLFAHTLVKTDNSTIAAGAIPDAIGLVFVDGEMPAGQWPILKSDSLTEIPYTYTPPTYYPSGAMSRIGVIPRIEEEIAGVAGTEFSVTVYNGGSEPSTTSAVDLSDAPDVSVVLSGSTNLSGDWTSSSSQGVTDNDRVTVLGSGSVGYYARVGQQYRDGSSNHAHLTADHYLMVLQDMSGGVYGTRHISRSMLPYVDVATPVTRVFTAVKKVSGSTIRTLNGTDVDGVTHGTTISMPHYSGFFDCGADAKMDFIAGTRATEAPLRWVRNLSHDISTGLLPPFDLTETSIAANDDVDYYPYFKGPFATYNMGTTGERDEIHACLPVSHARYLVNQTATDEKVVLVAGLVPAGWRATLRLSATQMPPVMNNGPDGAGASYTGLGASHPTWYYRPGNGAASGINIPPDNSGDTPWAQEDTTHHRPNPSYLPFLMTGRWEFLDVLMDYALQGNYYLEDGGTLNSSPWTGNIVSWFCRNITIGGTTYYNMSTIHPNGNLQRLAAWDTSARIALHVCLPNTDPAGTAIRQYNEDSLDDGIDGILAFHALQSADWQGINYWRESDQPSEGGWTHAYHLSAAAFAATATKKSNAVSYMNYFVKMFDRLAQRDKFAQAANFAFRNRDENSTIIESADDVLCLFNPPGLTQTPNVAAKTYTNNNAWWTPTNGDRWAMGGAPTGKMHYLVNVSGNTYQLAETLGGTAVALPGGSSTLDSIYLDPQVFSGESFSGAGGDYRPLVRSSLAWAKAAGATGVDTALTAANVICAINPVDYSASYNPKWAYDEAYAA